MEPPVGRGDVGGDPRERDPGPPGHPPGRRQEPREVGGGFSERLGETVGIHLERGRELAANGRMPASRRVRRALREIGVDEPAADEASLVDLDQDVERRAQKRPGVDVLVAGAPGTGHLPHRLVLEEEPPGPPPSGPVRPVLADARDDVLREELALRLREHRIDDAVEVEDGDERDEVGAGLVVGAALELEPAGGGRADDVLEDDVAHLVGDHVEILAVRLPQIAAGEAELDVPLARPGVVTDGEHARDDLEPALTLADERDPAAQVVLPDLQHAADRCVRGGRRELSGPRRHMVELASRIRPDPGPAGHALRVRRAPEICSGRRIAVGLLANRVDHADPGVFRAGLDRARTRRDPDDAGHLESGHDTVLRIDEEPGAGFAPAESRRVGPHELNLRQTRQARYFRVRSWTSWPSGSAAVSPRRIPSLAAAARASVAARRVCQRTIPSAGVFGRSARSARGGRYSRSSIAGPSGARTAVIRSSLTVLPAWPRSGAWPTLAATTSRPSASR